MLNTPYQTMSNNSLDNHIELELKNNDPMLNAPPKVKDHNLYQKIYIIGILLGLIIFHISVAMIYPEDLYFKVPKGEHQTCENQHKYIKAFWITENLSLLLFSIAVVVWLSKPTNLDFFYMWSYERHQSTLFEYFKAFLISTQLMYCLWTLCIVLLCQHIMTFLYIIVTCFIQVMLVWFC